MNTPNAQRQYDISYKSGLMRKKMAHQNYNFKEWRTIIVSMYKLSSSSVKWDKKKMQRSQYMYKIIYEK